MIANGDVFEDNKWGQSVKNDERHESDWPDDWGRVVYIDRYGNCMAGLRGEKVDKSYQIEAGGTYIPVVHTFSDCAVGEALCYQNSLGLLEIAVNQGSAAEKLSLNLRSQVSVRMLSDK